MKILFAALVTCVIPMMILCRLPDNNQGVYFAEPATAPTDPIVDRGVEVLFEKGAENIDLEEYIIQVVLGEMPADFELEALKAQAVVARTFTCRRIEQPKHNQAAVCTDSTCCQAFISVEEYLSNGGTQLQVDRIAQAVYETAGEVLVYGDELIEATYFSCSGGKTEDAQAVWGSDLPYLRSVESPGEESAAHYTDSITFSCDTFCEKLGIISNDRPEKWIEEIIYTNGGGVDSIKICGKDFSGTEVRKLLGLRSTAFVVTAAGSSITVTTKGFGHRVGMSQYGADAMAMQGADYITILQHYYQGTSLKYYSN